MITKFEQIERIFKEMTSHMETDADVHIIGGGALMYFGHKDLTKDVDLVVNTEKEFDEIVRCLKVIGFEPQIPDDPAYSRMAISQIFMRGTERIDLFCKYVCSKFALSDGMVRRAVKAGTYGLLNLFACSMEDVLLFKTMTEREGDLDDCIRVMEMRLLDWKTILAEAQEQSARGQGVWITWITDRMEELNGRGWKVPIIDEMRKLTDSYIDEWEKGLLERNPEFR